MIIKDPRFINKSQTLVDFILIDGNGNESKARLKVPENYEKGLNFHWDYILDNFDILEMKKKLERDLEANNARNALKDKKQKAAVNSKILSELFNYKTDFLNLPFLKDIPKEEKRLIRKAPTAFLFNVIANYIIHKHIEEGTFSFKDLIDEVEKKMYDIPDEE